jgi:2'-hydroxybiphenyl-2-sulfinate desulfinase
MPVKEFRYTICPVGNASFISANKEEFLSSGFKRLGVQPVLLQSLPKERWHVHFDYQDDALFREGGNIPPIWAKSNGAGVVLIGLTFIPQKSYIFTRKDAPIDYVEQLRGRHLGLPTRPDSIIDFFDVTIRHGFETALNARGVAPGEVQFVELPKTEAQAAAESGNDFHNNGYGQIEVEALDSGKVDAIYAGGVRAQRLIFSGKYKPIYEISANPEQLAPINNSYPNTLTVSRKLADDAPEVVVEYVKQALLASEWAKSHFSETLELFSRQLYGTPGEVVASLPINFHKALAPVLTREGLFALETEKRFLYDHGFIQKDFDIEKWADDSFLKTALAEINRIPVAAAA